jgi:hypothetical protein
MKSRNVISTLLLVATVVGCASTVFVKIPNADGLNIDTIYKVVEEPGWYVFLSRRPNSNWQLEKITEAANGYTGAYDEVLFVNKAKTRIQPYFFNFRGAYYFDKENPSVVTSFPCPARPLRTGLCKSSFLYPKEQIVETDVSRGAKGEIFSSPVSVSKMAVHRPEIARAVIDTDLFSKLPR